MQDKTEMLLVSLLVVIAIAAAALISFPSIPYVGYIGQVAFVFLWVYSIFWAFNVRRLLSARLYRNQALGLGLVLIGWVALNYSFISASNTLHFAALSLAGVLTFYWIDSSVLAGRKSDPLYRNTLYWRQLRLVLWPFVIVAVLAESAEFLFNPSGGVLINPTGLIESTSSVALLLLATSFFGVFVPGPVCLLVTASRSGDRTLRRHLQWFGLFALFLFVFLLAGGVTGQTTFIALGYVIGVYCLYRSAKSLAPLNRMPVNDPPRPMMT